MAYKALVRPWFFHPCRRESFVGTEIGGNLPVHKIGGGRSWFWGFAWSPWTCAGLRRAELGSREPLIGRQRPILASGPYRAGAGVTALLILGKDAHTSFVLPPIWFCTIRGLASRSGMGSGGRDNGAAVGWCAPSSPASSPGGIAGEHWSYPRRHGLELSYRFTRIDRGRWS
jgi:hypothetical protein